MAIVTLLPILLAALVVAPLPKPERTRSEAAPSEELSLVPGAKQEFGTQSQFRTPESWLRLRMWPQAAYDAGRDTSSRVFAGGARNTRVALRSDIDGRGVLFGQQADYQQELCIQEARSRSEQDIHDACAAEDEQRCEEVRRSSAAQMEMDIDVCEAEGRERARARGEAEREAEDRAREARVRWEQSQRRTDFIWWFVVVPLIAYGTYKLAQAEQAKEGME